MKAKPYRDRILYDRTVKGRRFWRELKVTDWIDAVIVRDRLEELEGIEKVRRDVPRFDDFAKRYLREDTANLAATFLRSRRGHLAPEGRLLKHLGAKRLDEITPETLHDWCAWEFTRPH